MDKNSSKKINLIPQEMTVPSSVFKITKIINKISIVLVILLITLIFISGGLIFYFSNRNSEVNKQVESLKSKVLSLNTNEQKMILAKDRLSKISVVQKDRSVDDELSRFKSFSDLVLTSTDSSISEANLSPKGSETSFTTKSSSSLANLLESISILKEYKRIIIASLTYNPNSGFLVNLSLEN